MLEVVAEIIEERGLQPNGPVWGVRCTQSLMKFWRCASTISWGPRSISAFSQVQFLLIILAPVTKTLALLCEVAHSATSDG